MKFIQHWQLSPCLTTVQLLKVKNVDQSGLLHLQIIVMSVHSKLIRGYFLAFVYMSLCICSCTMKLGKSVHGPGTSPQWYAFFCVVFSTASSSTVRVSILAELLIL